MKPRTSTPLRRIAVLGAAWTALALGPVATTLAADWPQWRGADRKDHSPDTGLLKSWPAEGPKRLWVHEDAGLGYSGPAIAGGRLYTQGLRGGEELLISVDAESGKAGWSTPIGPKYPNNWGDGPRSTPTVDGDRVYGLGGNGLLVCANAKDGKVLWQKSLITDLGGKLQGWGYTESPLVVGDLVLVTPGGADGTVAGLDKKTGAVRWRTKDLTDEAQYSSIILTEVAGKKQAVQLLMKRVIGFDPATGTVVWRHDFPGRVAVIPTPVAGPGGQIYVTAGYGVGCQSVQVAKDGKSVTQLYENKVMKNHHGGVVLVGEHLYGHSDGYGWVCQNLKTGEEVWVHKGFGKGAVHYADGMLYCLDERSGDVALVEASPKGWNEKGRFKLAAQSSQRSKQGGIWTHPVVVDGRLYLRDQELLSCYDVKGR